MDAEQLIESVRKVPFLYDQYHKSYGDHVKKDKAWKEIAKVVLQSPMECKKQWNNLRDSYRRLLKKRRRNYARANDIVKKWRYEDEMSFLNSYIKDRDAPNAVYLTASEQCETYGANDSDENPFHDDNSAPQAEASPIDLPASHVRKKVKTENSRDTPTRSVAQNAQESPHVAKTDLEIDLFFQMVAATVKKFTPYNQSLAKARVFAAISELEFSELSQGENETPIKADIANFHSLFDGNTPSPFNDNTTQQSGSSDVSGKV